MNNYCIGVGEDKEDHGEWGDTSQVGALNRNTPEIIERGVR